MRERSKKASNYQPLEQAWGDELALLGADRGAHQSLFLLSQEGPGGRSAAVGIIAKIVATSAQLNTVRYAAPAGRLQRALISSPVKWVLLVDGAATMLQTTPRMILIAMMVPREC